MLPVLTISLAVEIKTLADLDSTIVQSPRKLIEDIDNSKTSASL